jgi:hypothetical protein
LSETRKDRKFTAQQKTETVLASLRGLRTMAERFRGHDIADSLCASGASSSWRLAARVFWREEFETLDQARTKIDTYIYRYHHRPHSRMNYKTPLEVAATWQDPIEQSIRSGLAVNTNGLHAKGYIQASVKSSLVHIIFVLGTGIAWRSAGLDPPAGGRPQHSLGAVVDAEPSVHVVTVRAYRARR